ncbi:MAG: LysM peptidoglycan-binding domain-containing protein [Clostridia bacterium]|nr:LysM peptidoglycan-binding domain-containing protein [Clostridia bacterium]
MADYLSKGIDVSTWQKGVDYKRVASQNIKFVLCRASFGWEANQKDNMFETHIKGFKSVGIPVGAYHYSYATTPAEAEKEAKYFLSCIKGHKFELPVYYDMEENSMAKTGKANCTAIAEKFCDIVSKAGYLVGIYTNPNWLVNYLDYNKLFPKYELWLAQWSTQKDYSCGIWQYGGSTNYIESTKLDGISGNVDKNYMYKDYPSIIKTKGLNGFSKTTPEESTSNPSAGETSNDDKIDDNSYIVYTVKKGDTLSEIALKYSTTVEKLAKDNNISNPNLIYVGQKIKISSEANKPDTTGNKKYITYTVKPGDTLYSIANRYKTSIEKIVADNGIKNPNLIYADQKLKIFI